MSRDASCVGVGFASLTSEDVGTRSWRISLRSICEDNSVIASRLRLAI